MTNASDISACRAFAIALALIGIVGGCTPGMSKGKPFTIPHGKDIVVFGANSVDKASIANRSGEAVPGIEIEGASLIQDERDLQKSQQRLYVVFYDFLLGNMARGAYWSQLAARKTTLGSPSMDTHLTKILLVIVDGYKLVQTTEIRRVAHVRISVETNDFGRPFVP
jgi:hypothetical protein